MRTLSLCIGAVILSLSAVHALSGEQDKALNPGDLEWKIVSMRLVDDLDLGQYGEVPGGCYVDALPRGGDALRNVGDKPIPIGLGNEPQSVPMKPPKDGKLLIVTVNAPAQDGDLPTWPTYWACDVGIGGGWLIPCSAISAYSDAKGSLWNVADEIQGRPILSLLTRTYKSGQTASLQLVFVVEEWQIPKRGEQVVVLTLKRAAGKKAE